jgi:hypothetical protein
MADELAIFAGVIRQVSIIRVEGAEILLLRSPLIKPESLFFPALGEIEWVKPLRRGRFPGQILGKRP